MNTLDELIKECRMEKEKLEKVNKKIQEKLGKLDVWQEKDKA